MDYVVVDLETTIRNKVGRNKGSAHCSDNKVVAVGYAYNEDPVKTMYYQGQGGIHAPSLGLIHGDLDTLVLVGHNIKFDLLYLLRTPQFYRRFKEVTIWDTMLAEYLLTGQESKMASLDTVSLKYGGTIKDERIKEYWKNGVDTPDIPSSELIEYLKHDVENTRLVFKCQLYLAQQLGMVPLITSQMKALKATTIMEYNGMYFDYNQALSEEKYAQDFVYDTAAQFSSIFAQEFYFQEYNIRHYFEPNINSNKHLSAVLFGGIIEDTAKVQELDKDNNPVCYKSGLKKGQPKYRNRKLEFEYPALLNAAHTTANNNGYDVSESVLTKYKNNIKANGVSTTNEVKALRAIQLVLDYRRVNKELTTYYRGFRELCYDDSMIHGNLNHCRTHTGRLSSSEPNLQNMKGED